MREVDIDKKKIVDMKRLLIKWIISQNKNNNLSLCKMDLIALDKGITNIILESIAATGQFQLKTSGASDEEFCAPQVKKYRELLNGLGIHDFSTPNKYAFLDYINEFCEEIHLKLRRFNDGSIMMVRERKHLGSSSEYTFDLI